MTSPTITDLNPETLAKAPPRFHLLAKPSGSTCNLDYTYCFFLSKEALYSNEKSRISERTLENCIPQLLEAHRTPAVTIVWQGGEQYGRFLIDIYEEWIRHDVGKVFVQLFDVTRHAYFSQHLRCIHAPACGYVPALEHNGDLYACDHFVGPDFLLGNVNETHMLELVGSTKQRRFGDNKRDLLTAQCRECDVRGLCHGGCPKDRFVPSRDGEPGHNYLCPGLYRFFTHT